MSYFDLSNTNSAWSNQSNLVPMISSFGAQNLMAPAVQSLQSNVSQPALTAATANAGAGSSGFGFNMPTAQLLLGGLSTIGGIWNAWESQKLAKKQFAYQKDVTETNLRNQIQAYNTTLEDRGRSRAFTEGQSSQEAQSYIDKNRLTR